MTIIWGMFIGKDLNSKTPFSSAHTLPHTHLWGQPNRNETKLLLCEQRASVK